MYIKFQTTTSFGDMAINEADEKQSNLLEHNLPEQIKRKKCSFCTNKCSL